MMIRTTIAVAAVAMGAVALTSCGTSGTTARRTRATLAAPAGTTTSTSMREPGRATTTTTAPSTNAAPPAPVTITTTPAPAPATSAAAVSASFVSPRHGWVLERSGRVSETTDAGATWHRVGQLSVAIPNGVGTQIRFADATHGFVLSSSPEGKLFGTVDGGAHWQPTKTPFVDVFALTISRGTVYVVAMQPSDAHLRIWSSPADALSWTEDPLSIPPGAGPAISIQLVLSGAHGWLIENDRGVVGGARLSSGGRWIAWKPPLGDGVSVAASTGSDLVAGGQEGVWTGPRITNDIYFSHDGGATFQRRDAPDVGAVASPNPSTAIVATDNGLQRTTDEGRTWQAVFREPQNYGAADIGMTTTTQGFVIFGDGTMLMTYDVGATWRPATHP